MRRSFSPGRHLRAVLRVTFLDAPAALSAALILFGLIQGGVPPLTRVARAGAVASFATLAYAVYLFHYPILETIELRVLHGATGGAILVELAGFAVVVVLPIALVAHLFIEKPFLNLKERLRAPAPFSAAPHFLGEPRAADR
jgi:peptidoglycan/LPS O-acetylase OafA/YrhL